MPLIFCILRCKFRLVAVKDRELFALGEKGHLFLKGARPNLKMMALEGITMPNMPRDPPRLYFVKADPGLLC